MVSVEDILQIDGERETSNERPFYPVSGQMTGSDSHVISKYPAKRVKSMLKMQKEKKARKKEKKYTRRRSPSPSEIFRDDNFEKKNVSVSDSFQLNVLNHDDSEEDEMIPRLARKKKNFFMHDMSLIPDWSETSENSSSRTTPERVEYHHFLGSDLDLFSKQSVKMLNEQKQRFKADYLGRLYNSNNNENNNLPSLLFEEKENTDGIKLVFLNAYYGRTISHRTEDHEKKIYDIQYSSKDRDDYKMEQQCKRQGEIYCTALNMPCVMLGSITKKSYHLDVKILNLLQNEMGLLWRMNTVDGMT